MIIQFPSDCRFRGFPLFYVGEFHTIQILGNPWVISRIGSIPPLLGSAPSFRGRSAGSFPEQLLIIEHISRDERNIYHATHA